MSQKPSGWVLRVDVERSPTLALHVIPLGVALDHFPETICWCEPFLDYKNPENGHEVWKHHHGDE